MKIEHFKKGDKMPMDWVEITFLDGESLDDYPLAVFEFMVDCEVRTSNNERIVNFDGDQILYIGNIHGASLRFTPTTNFQQQSPATLNLENYQNLTFGDTVRAEIDYDINPARTYLCSAKAEL